MVPTGARYRAKQIQNYLQDVARQRELPAAKLASVPSSQHPPHCYCLKVQNIESRYRYQPEKTEWFYGWNCVISFRWKEDRGVLVLEKIYIFIFHAKNHLGQRIKHLFYFLF